MIQVKLAALSCGCTTWTAKGIIENTWLRCERDDTMAFVVTFLTDWVETDGQVARVKH